VVAFLLANPTCTLQEAADYFKCVPETIRAVALKEGLRKEWRKQ